MSPFAAANGRFPPPAGWSRWAISVTRGLHFFASALVKLATRTVSGSTPRNRNRSRKTCAFNDLQQSVDEGTRVGTALALYLKRRRQVTGLAEKRPTQSMAAANQDRGAGTRRESFLALAMLNRIFAPAPFSPRGRGAPNPPLPKGGSNKEPPVPQPRPELADPSSGTLPRAAPQLPDRNPRRRPGAGFSFFCKALLTRVFCGERETASRSLLLRDAAVRFSA